MILLDEQECRSILENPAINHRQMARWFYEDVEAAPALPDHAFRRVLSVSPMTERTRMRISLTVLRHLADIAKAFEKVNGDENNQILRNKI